MSTTNWQAVIIEAAGNQPRLGRAFQCDPAWSVYAKHREPDGEIGHPSRGKQYIFVNRHLDRRFSIDYPFSTREAPRVLGKTIGDLHKEWDAVAAVRDGYLYDAGLSTSSAPAAIAECLANTFKANSYFKDKPSCTTWGEPTRSLAHAVEGLLHKSFCVGCAHAYAAMADMSGLPCRTIGCGAHRVAEVLVDGRWHHVENSCRHEGSEDLGAYMPASFMEITVNPSAYPQYVPARKIDGYLGMPNPQFHFMGGSWQCPKTLRFAASCAKALYPELDRIIFKSLYGKLVPLVVRAEGFYWEDTPAEIDELTAADATRRKLASPYPVEPGQMGADYLFHPFKPGTKIRQSVWLDDLDIVEGLAIEIPFVPETNIDFGDALGGRLTLKVNDMNASLVDLGAWPPAARNTRGMRLAMINIPADALKANALNWIELRNGSAQTPHATFIPAAMDPYIPPMAQE